MPKRRNAIAMTPEEQEAYLREPGHTLQVATIGPAGYPHLVAMNYAVIDGKIHFTSYAKAQKVLNLRRDPKITVMIESGKQYSDLRGLVIQGQADIIEGDLDLAVRVVQGLQAGMEGAHDTASPTEDAIRTLAKRVVIRVNPVHGYSWDHRKLGSVY
jgi:nitroimidazol reductase NimA-like FMN-containing flavoprotein (pyridoxamine 5'-phosphate oxidase superfamily)